MTDLCVLIALLSGTMMLIWSHDHQLPPTRRDRQVVLALLVHLLAQGGLLVLWYWKG